MISKIVVVEATTASILHLIGVIRDDDKLDIALELLVAEAAQDGEDEEGQAEDEQQSEHDPFEFLREYERSKHTIHLILRPD